MSAFASYWTGWAGVLLGCYGLAITFVGIFTDQITFEDTFSFVIFSTASIVFFIAGVLSIMRAKNLVNRVRIINFLDNGFRIEFWWRGRRKDIEFTSNDVESVEPCQKEKGIIKLLAKLPREPICYQIQVRDQPGFIVTGTDEAIHEIAKRLKEIDKVSLD